MRLPTLLPALALLALRHTAFERTEAGIFYTPSKWIGLGVTALLLGRLGARLIVAYRIAEESLASGETNVCHAA